MHKVLFISHLYPREYDPLYGMVVHRQAYGLKKLGCEVKVISPVIGIPALISRVKKGWKNYQSVPNETLFEGIPIYHPKINPIVAKYFSYKSGLWTFKKYENLIEEVYKDFKFTHIHAQTALFNGLLGLKIAEKYNVPLTTTVNGTDIDLELYKSSKHLSTMKEILLNSDAVTVPSPVIQKKVKERIGIDSKVIPRGIYLDQIYRNGSKLKEKYENKFIILSVSRLLESKGLDLNLFAISNLKDEIRTTIKYLVIGEGPEEEKLRSLAKDLKIEDNVEFIGFQEKEKVMEYMSICNLFSLPSWQETFGLVYLEAMAHEKVVIGSKGQGVDGVIKHMVNGLLVKEKDIDDLKNLMEFSFNNKEEINQMGARAREDVFNGYSWEKIAIQNNSLYNAISFSNR